MGDTATIKTCTFDATRRVIAIHAASTSLHRDRCPVCPRMETGCVSDAGQCRLWLNEARREIDQLRRGNESAPSRPIPCDTFTPSGECPSEDQPAANHRSTRSYAPPAIGDVAGISDRQNPPPPQTIAITNHYHVTNLATLLDVLA